LRINKYKYNHDWLTGLGACAIRQACGKKKLTEKEWHAEKNEGDADLML
jgi:hypothetical protein